MEFTYIVTKNNQPIAGFITFNDACIYKDMCINITHIAGYKDRFRIIKNDIPNNDKYPLCQEGGNISPNL